MRNLEAEVVFLLKMLHPYKEEDLMNADNMSELDRAVAERGDSKSGLSQGAEKL